MAEAEKKARKKVKGENTRQKLFETAGQLFGERGFDEVSVDAIVAAAGVSKGTFYIHFESKDALIAELLSVYVRGADADYQAHLDSLPEEITATNRLLSLIARIADVLTESIGCDRMRLVYKVQLTGATDMEVVKGYGRQLYGIFGELLRRGVESGEFRTELTLDELTKHFVMAIRGLSYEWCIRHPDFDLKAQALAHFGLLLSGIRA